MQQQRQIEQLFTGRDFGNYCTRPCAVVLARGSMQVTVKKLLLLLLLLLPGRAACMHRLCLK
jgi:hypothetical protein